MKVSLILSLISLIVGGHLAWVPPDSLGMQRRFLITAENKSDRQRSDAERRGDQTMENASRQRRVEEIFLADFLRLPPKERVGLWEEGKDPTGRGLIKTAMDDALIARGVDAVQYLAETVLKGDSYHQSHALKVLCDMDRFVSLEQLPLPDVGAAIYVQPLDIKGRLNPFMIVDGRRIGMEGLEVVKWAAEQASNKDLRFHARLYSGILEQDLRHRTLQEQIDLWRQSVSASKGLLGLSNDTDSYNTAYLLKGILIERAPESIPPLVDLIEKSLNGYVTEEALALLLGIDRARMRLRATETGRLAINSIHRALERGGLKPVYTSKAQRDRLWEQISSEVFQDAVAINHASSWSVVAMALEEFYKINLTKRSYTVQPIIEALPEIREFVTYLTAVDPYFPSWEFTSTGDPRDDVFNSRFKEKMARYYGEWKRFKSVSMSRSPSHVGSRRLME